METDGFQLVKKKKAAKRRQLKNTNSIVSTEDTVHESIKKILKAKEVLESSPGHANLITNLKRINQHTAHLHNTSQNLAQLKPVSEKLTNEPQNSSDLKIVSEKLRNEPRNLSDIESGLGNSSDLKNRSEKLENKSQKSSNLKNELEKSADVGVDRIVCYGLGLISASRIARYQTALLLILRDHFGVTVEVYDPAFKPTDLELLRSFGFEILRENEEGRRCVSAPTIFYMPHCAKELYNNLLYANWMPETLQKCIIIGNSFSSIASLPSRILKSYQYVVKAGGFCEEIEIRDLCEFDVFNELCIHLWTQDFIKGSAEEKDEGFWNRVEPNYENCDVEIVRQEET